MSSRDLLTAKAHTASSAGRVVLAQPSQLPFVRFRNLNGGFRRPEALWPRSGESMSGPFLPNVAESQKGRASKDITRRHRLYASAGTSSGSNARKKSTASMLASIALVLTLAVANRVLNKMATVPMGEYLFFLALIQTFGYVLFYGAILSSRIRSGQVSKKMLQTTGNKKFAFIGFLEATAQVVSMVCVSKLPGVVLPLLNQTILLWQVVLGYTVQGQRYSSIQLAGIFLVVGGVAKAAWPQGAGGSILGQTNPIYAAVFSAAFLLLAAAGVMKDNIFADASKKLDGQKLDLFVVNTKGSLAQAGFVLLLLPVMSSLKGISFQQLPAYCSQGVKAFGGAMPGSSGAPLVPLLYIAVNLAMNISVLNLLRTSGALITTLTMSSTIPLTIFAFTFPWPLIGAPGALNANFLVGTVVLLAGLAAYNYPKLSGKTA